MILKKIYEKIAGLASGAIGGHDEEFAALACYIHDYLEGSSTVCEQGTVKWIDATKELPIDRSNVDEKISEMVLVTYKNDSMFNALSVSVAWYSYIENTWNHIENPLYWAYYPAPCALARKVLGTKVMDHKYA